MSIGTTRLPSATQATAVVAVVSATCAAVRYQLAQGVTPSLLVALLLLPVWWTALREYRLGRAVIFVGAAAAVWGPALTWLDGNRATSLDLLQVQSLTFLSFVGTIGLLLWCRSQIGSARTAICFGVGGMLNALLIGPNAENPWKFTFAIPVAVVILGLAARSGRTGVQAGMLLALGGISLTSDARSMTAFFLLAAAIVVAQAPLGRHSRVRPWQVILLLAFAAAAAFLIFQALLLDGALGEAAQQRTRAQIDASGSLVAGGRPEIGAATALLLAQPWGYGSGTIPSPNDIWTAKVGMSQLNYDPFNGYVNQYMFGGRYEVHSVIGDLWIWFGPLGAAFALLLLSASVYAAARSAALGALTGLAAYLLLLGVWDTFFSPLWTSISNLALMFALLAIAKDIPGEVPAVPNPSAPHLPVTRASRFRA